MDENVINVLEEIVVVLMYREVIGFQEDVLEILNDKKVKVNVAIIRVRIIKINLLISKERLEKVNFKIGIFGGLVLYSYIPLPSFKKKEP